MNVPRPATLDDVLRLLAAGQGPIVAGGTDLMVKRRRWSGTLPALPETAVFVAQIPELRGVHASGDAVTIGAATPLSSLLVHPLVPALLKAALAETAGPAIRNMATLGGNLANASPAADPALALACLGASVRLARLSGFRDIPVDAFATGPGKTGLSPDELIVSVVVPDVGWTQHAFVKVGGRRADAISKVAFAGCARVAEGRLDRIRVAFGAVGPTIVVADDVCRRLEGLTTDACRESLPQLLETLSDRIRPIDDQRSTAAYRKQVALNLFTDFIVSLH